MTSLARTTCRLAQTADRVGVSDVATLTQSTAWQAASLALTPASLIDDGLDFGVVLKTLEIRPGRPSKAVLQHSPKRYVPIVDTLIADRIQSYLYAGRFRKDERISPIARQTVNRHIQAVVEEFGRAPFKISAHTFRHSLGLQRYPATSRRSGPLPGRIDQLCSGRWCPH